MGRGKDAHDWGWSSGILTGQRPWFAAIREEGPYSVAIFYFSADGIEKVTEAFLVKRYIGQLLEFLDDRRLVKSGLIWQDGFLFWRIWVALGDRHLLFTRDRFETHPYPGQWQALEADFNKFRD